jgi:hypothetical protein
MNPPNELVPRALLIDEFRISDSCERRRRKEGVDWPPHVLIGRKVYYRRESLCDWLLQRESIVPGRGGVGNELDGLVVALRRAKVLSRLMDADEQVSTK